jgi:hypothetical protein
MQAASLFFTTAKTVSLPLRASMLTTLIYKKSAEPDKGKVLSEKKSKDTMRTS